jgi:hypothetical protein
MLLLVSEAYDNHRRLAVQVARSRLQAMTSTNDAKVAQPRVRLATQDAMTVEKFCMHPVLPRLCARADPARRWRA